MKALLGTALLAWLCLPTLVAAHHSPAMFDSNQRLKLSGTVSKFQWTNPHTYIQLVVKNERGQEEEWSIEAAAPIYLQQEGWKPSSLKVGDHISVVIAPLRKMITKKGGLLIEATAADGKVIGKRAGKTS